MVVKIVSNSGHIVKWNKAVKRVYLGSLNTCEQ